MVRKRRKRTRDASLERVLSSVLSFMDQDILKSVYKQRANVSFVKLPLDRIIAHIVHDLSVCDVGDLRRALTHRWVRVKALRQYLVAAGSIGADVERLDQGALAAMVCDVVPVREGPTVRIDTEITWRSNGLVGAEFGTFAVDAQMSGPSTSECTSARPPLEPSPAQEESPRLTVLPACPRHEGHEEARHVQDGEPQLPPQLGMRICYEVLSDKGGFARYWASAPAQPSSPSAYLPEGRQAGNGEPHREDAPRVISCQPPSPERWGSQRMHACVSRYLSLADSGNQVAGDLAAALDQLIVECPIASIARMMGDGQRTPVAGLHLASHRVPEAFPTIHAYRRSWAALIAVEALVVLGNDLLALGFQDDTFQGQPFHVPRESTTLCHLRLVSGEIPNRGLASCALVDLWPLACAPGGGGPSGGHAFAQEGAVLLLIEPAEGIAPRSFLAVCKERGEGDSATARVHVSVRDALDGANPGPWQLVRVGCLKTAQRQVEALVLCDQLHTSPRIAGAQPARPLAEVHGKHLAQLMGCSAGVVDSLNPSQRRVLAVCASHGERAATSPDAGPRFVLVQGPPGTGKTRTVAAMFACLSATCAARKRVLRPFAQCANTMVPPPPATVRAKVLLCAQSNMALDAALQCVVRLFAQGGASWKPAIARLGPLDAMAPEVRKFSVDVLRGGAERPHRERLVREADLTCATVTGAGMNLIDEAGAVYDALIVDEASQVTEPQMLVALRRLRPRAVVVLVGDPAQLPATVLSRYVDLAGGGTSFFDRMVAMGAETLLLDTQYRMHPAISAFPSAHFYMGRIRDGVSAQDRAAPYHAPASPALGPFAMYDVVGMERIHGSSLAASLENAAEATVVLELLGRLRLAAPDAEVAVLSFYSAQVSALRRRYTHRGASSGKGVTFSTVDNFQGREADAVLISAVRAGGSTIGFVADDRRLNVALTRARSSVIVVCDAETLSSRSSSWAALVAHAKGTGAFVSSRGGASCSPAQGHP